MAYVSAPPDPGQPLTPGLQPRPRPLLKPKPPAPRKADGDLDVPQFLEQKPKVGWMPKSMAARDALKLNKAGFPKRILKYMPTPGVPPGPPKVYRSEEATAQHVYQWNPETTLAANFRPDRHTIMIQGRPMQAASLCHSQSFFRQKTFRKLSLSPLAKRLLRLRRLRVQSA